jgi:hypothetical protein
MVTFIEDKFSSAVSKVIYSSAGSTNQYKNRQHFISLTSHKEEFGIYGIFCRYTWKE